MKKLLLFLLIFLSIGFSGCLSDIRTAYVLSNKYNLQDEQVRGQGLIDMAVLNVGGSKWDEVETYTVDFQEHFLNFTGKLVNPFKDPEVNMKMQFNAKGSDGKMTIESGKEKGKSIGIKDNLTYTIEDGEQLFKENKKTRFWLPTYKYFIEFPFRIKEAGIISYAGERSYNGKPYDLIMASWKTLEPQKDLDQYLIWIGRESGRIEIVQYTIRAQMKWLKGTAFFENYFEKDGIQFPGKIKVKTKINGRSYLHIMSINDIMLSKSDWQHPGKVEQSITKD